MSEYLSVEPMQMDTDDVYMEQGEAMAVAFQACLKDEDAQQSPQHDDFVVDCAPFEIESYCAQFSCYGKIQRLLFIADHCPALSVEALEHLHNYIKSSTFNVTLYQQVQHRLVASKSGEKLKRYQLDLEWMDKTGSTAKQFADKLESELKNYKTNSIKESIRRGYDDIAKHYIECGDLNNALRCYFRSRDYCMGDQQLFSVCLSIARLSLYLGNYVQMHTFLVKAEMLPEVERNAFSQTKLDCMLGLYNLLVARYKMAANKFFSASFDRLTSDSMSAILSPNCVAVYGTLCALASYDRAELKSLLFANNNFKLFLELEPQVREAAVKFYESKYTNSLSILGEAKDAFMLDLYLSPHVKTLYSLIRSRALVLYFRPYMSADLRSMSTAFHTSLAQLEEELLELILSGHVKARIDSHKKILYAKDVDKRIFTFERCLDMSRSWCRISNAAMLRAACTKNGSIFIRNEPSKLKADNGRANVSSNNADNNDAEAQSDDMDTAPSRPAGNRAVGVGNNMLSKLKLRSTKTDDKKNNKTD